MTRSKLIPTLIAGGILLAGVAVSRPAAAAATSNFFGYACSVSFFPATSGGYAYVRVEPRSQVNCGGTAINQVWMSSYATYKYTDVELATMYSTLTNALVNHKKIFFYYDASTGEISNMYVYDQ